MEVSSLRPAAHIDASRLPLERVASSTQLTQQQKLNEVSRAFEAELLRQVLQQTQTPLFKSKYVGNSTADGIYRDQVVNQLAESISKSGGLGLGKSLALALQRRKALATHTTAGHSPAPSPGLLSHGTKTVMRPSLPPGPPPAGTIGRSGGSAGQGAASLSHLAKKPCLEPPKHD